MTESGNALSVVHKDHGCTCGPESRTTQRNHADRRSTSDQAPTAAESTMPISITSTRSTDDTRLIEVVGEVDILTAPAIRDAVYAQLHTGHPESLILDLSAVTFFGITGLRLLPDVREVTSQYGARLRIARISPPVFKVVNLAGLAPLFDVADPRVMQPAQANEGVPMPQFDPDPISLHNPMGRESEAIPGCSHGTTEVDKPHWHLLGPYFRPLHEQLDALSDAAVWAGVAVDSDGFQQLFASPQNGDPGLTITCMQRGSEYAAVSIVGDVGLNAIQRLQRYVRVLLEDGVRTLVIDLSGLSRCDRRLAPLLARLQRILRAKQGVLQVARVPYELRSVLTTTDLPDAFAACGADMDIRGPSHAEI